MVSTNQKMIPMVQVAQAGPRVQQENMEVTPPLMWIAHVLIVLTKSFNRRVDSQAHHVQLTKNVLQENMGPRPLVQ
jgi:hypothetical protein